MAVVSAFFYTHTPPCCAAAGGVFCTAMQHLIRRIMLNYYANPLISITYRQLRLLRSHASHANHNI